MKSIWLFFKPSLVVFLKMLEMTFCYYDFKR